MKDHRENPYSFCRFHRVRIMDYWYRPCSNFARYDPASNQCKSGGGPESRLRPVRRPSSSGQTCGSLPWRYFAPMTSYRRPAAPPSKGWARAFFSRAPGLPNIPESGPLLFRVHNDLHPILSALLSNLYAPCYFSSTARWSSSPNNYGQRWLPPTSVTFVLIY